jgi:hypothetical protein
MSRPSDGPGTISPGRHDVGAVRTRDSHRRSVSEIPERQLERIDALFVQSATSLTSAGDTVTLHGLSDSTVYFADRPRREVGHIPSRRFIELWETGESSFSIDPPNAVLSFLDDDGEAPEDAVVLLRDPSLEGDKLSYTVELLEGSLPARSGPCTLFIDVFGRRLSPASVTPMNRRAGRQWHRSEA